MQHFLVRYDIDASFFKLPKEKQTKLQDAEIAHAAKVWAEGHWLFFLTNTDYKINWGVYRAASLDAIEKLLPQFPMFSWYTTHVHEITIVEPWKLGLDDLATHFKQVFTDK